MSHSARIIADWFLKEAEREGEVLSQMKLQKLVYISQGWHLALTGRPLMQEDVQAWKWGPVFPSLYHTFARFGAGGIDAETPIQPKFDEWTNAFLERIWDIYKGYTAAQLSDKTHQVGTPWRNFYSADKRHVVIPKEEIKKHYEHLRDSR